MGWFKKHSVEEKVFVIGFNKTGTTSLERFFRDHGFSLGNQAKGELLLDDYAKRNWKPIIQFCKTADVFQDIPFSLPYTYVVLDREYPTSKFILSVRSSAEEWYQSLIRFHGRLFANGNKPTAYELKNAQYRYPGFVYKAMRIGYGAFDENIYNEMRLKSAYERHIINVQEYFRYRDNFLCLNIGDKGAVKQLSDFLKLKPKYEHLPWENRYSKGS